MNGYLEHGDPAEQNWKTLMQYLKHLRKEGAVITSWLPEYESHNGKHTGRFWVTINGQEKA